MTKNMLDLGIVELEDILAGMKSLNKTGEETPNVEKLQKRLERSIELLKQYKFLQPDELTGLPSNKASERFFIQGFRDAQESYKTGQDYRNDEARYANFSVMIIDIDDFTKFNDRHGHDIGDRVLKVVGQKLEYSTKSTDIVFKDYHNYDVARDGGEEFVVVLPNTNIDKARIVANRLVREMSRNKIDGKYEVTISCGTTSRKIDLEEELTDEMIKEELYLPLKRQADNALYAAKNNGKNRFEEFNPEIDYATIRQQYNAKKSGNKQSNKPA